MKVGVIDTAQKLEITLLPAYLPFHLLAAFLLAAFRAVEDLLGASLAGGRAEVLRVEVQSLQGLEAASLEELR